MKNFIRKNFVWIALPFIIGAALFFRTYHFDDWLYFKMDQSRDALLVSNAVQNGWEHLPLLGPRAGATDLKHGFLRLGPVFYYFQYLSGKIFHSTEPPVFAYPDLAFSMAAVLLLYCFARLYFNRGVSLLVTAMYACSFIIIQYSRFAWNPNALQFFLLLTFYGLLRFLNETREPQRRWWLSVWALGLTIGSQLHFFGFFSLVGISGIVILLHARIWQRERFLSLFQLDVLWRLVKYFGVGLIVVGLLYTPVIISDTVRHGQNFHNFFEALGSKPESRPFLQKVTKGIEQHLQYYCLITTSDCYGGVSLPKDFFPIVVTVSILLSGTLLIFLGLRLERDPLRRDFLTLLVVWMVVFTILTIPVSFQLRPRFFIVVFAVPFLLLGLTYDYLLRRFGKQLWGAILFITGIVIISNLYGTLAWFSEQARSQQGAFPVQRTLILKTKDGVTLGQLQRASDWMYLHHQTGTTLYYYVKPEHIRPFRFLFWNRQNPTFVYKTLEMNGDPSAEYFAITPTESGLGPVKKKFGEDFTVVASQQFGQIVVSKIIFPHRTVAVGEFHSDEPRAEEDRVFWGDVIGGRPLPDTLSAEEGGDEEN